MRIVIFSTNTNYYDTNTFVYKKSPLNAQEIERLVNRFPQHQFVIATQLPGMFLLDLNTDDDFTKCSGVEYHLLQKNSERELAEEILELKPDAAVAATFWTTPYDWLPVKDSMVGHELNLKGIKTYCHPLEISVACFDKWRTHQMTEKIFPMAKAVYVHHSLFINAGNRKEIKSNLYRDSVLMQIKELHFPVVIKDTVGLSSYGMDVINSFGDAVTYLNSKRNTSDRIIEEFIPGLQFGLEVYGSDGNYFVSDPFMFSVNRYGITSPKQSVKLGPVTDEHFCVSELKKKILRLADELKFSGAAQIDLVFSNNVWYLIEINPRLSGMSEIVAACENKSVLEILIENTVLRDEVFSDEQKFSDGKNSMDEEKKYVFDFKLPLLTEEQFDEVKNFPSVKYICQTQNLAARQLRERGFCEIIFGNAAATEELKNQLDEIKKRFPQIIESVFYENAIKLLGELNQRD